MLLIRRAYPFPCAPRNARAFLRRGSLKRLQDPGATTYRTDMTGAVTFYLDARTVSPELACLH